MSQKWTYHIILWSVYFIFKSIDLFDDPDGDWRDVLLSMTVPVITIFLFYIYYFQVWPKFLNKRFFWLLLLLVPLGIFVFMGIRYFLEERVYLWLFGFDNYNDRVEIFSYYFFDNYLRILPFIGISGVLYMTEQKLEADNIRIRLKQEKTEAELTLLRSQLNPHFLFNTLSYLYTEAYQINEPFAEKMLTLSNILRYTMHSSQVETKSLEEEVAFLEDYLNIFRDRFEGKCFVEFTHSFENPALLIEPLLFISFLENAFKHGIFNDPAHPILIEMTEQNQKLSFSCKNKINKHQKDPGSGIGLSNVKKRLALRYQADAYNLEIKQQDDFFMVNLNIQL